MFASAASKVRFVEIQEAGKHIREWKGVLTKHTAKETLVTESHVVLV